MKYNEKMIRYNLFKTKIILNSVYTVHVLMIRDKIFIDEKKNNMMSNILALLLLLTNQ
jgi:hypothetical protein